MTSRAIVKKFSYSANLPDGLIANFIGDASDIVSRRASVTKSNLISETIPGTSIPAMKFAGAANSYLLAKNTDKLQLVKTAGTSFTVEAWIYATGVGQNPSGYGGEIVNKDSEFEFCRMGDGRIAVAVDWSLGTDKNLPGGGWIIPPAGTAVVPLNTPTHVAIVVDNTILKIVLNGSLAWTKTGLDRQARKDNTDFYIGNRTGKNQGFAGYIGDVRIWDHARSVDQIFAYLNTRFESAKANYTLTVGFDATVTAHAWGGGGAGGSGDVGNHIGGDGAPGLYNTRTFTVSKGDVIEVTVGQGGFGGQGGRPATGGQGGQSRININSQAARSMNGGNGGNSPVSGAGGGGGGASLVLVNGDLTLAAGGGGGGGGAGSSSNGKSSSIFFNSMNPAGSISVQSSNFNATTDKNTVFIDVNDKHVVYGFTRGHTLAIFNPNTLVLESKQTFDTYATQNSTALTNALNAVANGKLIAIGSFDACTVDQTLRNLLNSQFGGTRTEIWSKSIGTKLPRTSHIFISIKNGGVPAIEEISSASNSTGIIKETFNAGLIIASDWRGQDGQNRTSDGGSSGGGGGGYPGGAGGTPNTGDNGAEPGQTGGNFPVKNPSRGETVKYYNGSYGQYGKGGSAAGDGENGYVVLEIAPVVSKVAVSGVKVSGTWRQVVAGYVKIAGAWETIDSVYIKTNGTWKLVTSTGDIGGIIDPQATNTNIGRSQRTYA